MGGVSIVRAGLAGRLARAAGLGALALLGACSSETLFQSNFNSTTVGQPPAAVQAIGTASVFGPAGSVVIADAPPGLSEHWLKIGRASSDAAIAGMQGQLSKTPGIGKYSFLAAVYMPKGAGLATIQFEPAFQPPNAQIYFLHLDLTQDDKVQIDDMVATRFGSFPRDQSFDVVVSLDTTVTPAMAHISLLGNGATGAVDYPIQSSLVQFAQQFGAIRVWMGYPWTGSFLSTDITVSHLTQ
jgi:hypothetical protein